MKEENIRLSELFKKYLDNNISENELAEFSGYVEDPLFALQIQNLLQAAFVEGNQELSLRPDSRQRILNTILLDTAPNFARQPRIKLWHRLTIAAAAVIILFSILFLYQKPKEHINKSAETTINVNDIAPGKNRATLTLANGKSFNLSESKTGVAVGENSLAYNDGSIIAMNDVNTTSEGTLLFDRGFTIATPKGGTYELTLSDGTKVWLNAETTLTYHYLDKRDSTKRTVDLTGEAYFEVAPVHFRDSKKSIPFIVTSTFLSGQKKQQIEVLGTRFNVHAYSDEDYIETTLLEGSVKVNLNNNRASVLKPNQQSVLRANNNITIQDVDALDAIDWKNGDFIFRNETLEQIMKKLERWYSVEVVYNPSVNKEQRFGGKVSRMKNISQVLKIMQTTGQINFKIDGNTIYVTQ